MLATLKPIVIRDSDCPVELTSEIRTHLEIAITAQASMSGPLAFLTPWTAQDRLIVTLSRELQWLVAHAPINFDALRMRNGGVSYHHAMHNLGGEQDRSWASAINLMTQRHMSSLFEVELDDSVFKLTNPPLSDADTPDAGTYAVSYIDFDFSLFVQAVLVNSWLWYHDVENMRRFVETWQLEQARRFVEAVIDKFAAEHPVLGSDEARPSCYTTNGALVLWRENLRVATAAYDKSREVAR